MIYCKNLSDLLNIISLHDFYIFSESNCFMANDLASFLVKFNTRFEGFHPSLELEPKNKYLLVFRAQQINKLVSLDKGCYKHVIVFPVCFDYIHGYFQILNNLNFTIDNSHILVKESDWYQYLIQENLLTQEKGWRRLTWFGHYKLNKNFPFISNLYPETKNKKIGNFAKTYHKDFIETNNKKINQVMKLWQDQKSKNNYSGVFNFSSTQLLENFLEVLLNDLQYFSYDLVDTDDVILNFGIDGGFEIPYFINEASRKNNFNSELQLKIYNIDPFGYEFLKPYVKEYIDVFHKNNFLLAFAYSETKHHIDIFYNNVSKNVPCLNLNDLLEKLALSKIDLIKMDIEGAEEELVYSDAFADLIKQYRPKLAIAIYHTVDHLIDIPLKIASLCKNYNFYCGFYHYVRYEVILYAIPKERDANQYSIKLDID